MSKLRIGVSSCILKNDNGFNYITLFLRKWFDLVSVCPNTDCENFDKKSKNIIGYKTDENIDNVVAIILKADNTLCEPQLLKEVLKRYPVIPIESSVSVNDPIERDRFVLSIFILKRWREIDTHIESVITFHKRHKYLLQSFNSKQYKRLDRVITKTPYPFYGELKSIYQTELLILLKNRRSRSAIYKVLMDMFNIVKNYINIEDKYELKHMITLYKRDEIPLLEPLTLIRHYVKSLSIYALEDEYLINPTSIELNLLFHA